MTSHHAGSRFLLRSAFSYSGSFWLGGAILTLLLGASPRASAQPLPPDPVEDLRNALTERIIYPSPIDASQRQLRKDLLAYRKKQLVDRAALLKSLAQLTQGITLQEWRTGPLVPEDEQQVDVDVLSSLEKRTEARLKALLEQTPEPGSLTEFRQISAARVVGQLGALDRSQKQDPQATRARGVAEKLSPLLLTAFQNDKLSEAVQIESLRALGKVNPRNTGEIITAINARTRDNPSEALQIAAMEVQAELASGLIPLLEDPTRGATVATRERLVRVGKEVLPQFLKGMSSNNPVEVRRYAVWGMREIIKGLRLMSKSLDTLKNKTYPANRMLTRTERQNIEGDYQLIEALIRQMSPLKPIFEKDLAPLSEAINDPDGQVREHARETIEELASLRNSFQDRINALPPIEKGPGIKPPPPPPGGEAEEQEDRKKPEGTPVGNAAVKQLVPALQEGLSKSNTVQQRLLALQALERAGAQAREAASDVAVYLENPNPFVRWAAARALGKISDPKAPENSAVSGLVRLLSDEDLDVRVAAATALTRFYPEPSVTSLAVPALAREIANPKRDDEIRVEFLQTLLRMGVAAKDAVPAVVVALGAKAKEVRLEAATALGRLGPLAKDAIPALEQALKDEDAGVRRAASEALLNVTAG